ncbi:MAG: hypothetical protein P0116_01485 [Candidatus Nitrosocosmicus sp.]|nr:hypothetical protein [Candidatus Nitrosocosmicus sp.]
MKKKDKSLTGSHKATTIKMKVAECRIKDVGKKKAILDRISMEKLGVTDGDVIEIAGKKITTVSVFGFEDKNKKTAGFILMARLDKMQVLALMITCWSKRLDLRPVERIVLSCNTLKNFSDEFNLYLNNRFERYPVTKGEQFTLNFLGTSLSLKSIVQP